MPTNYALKLAIIQTAWKQKSVAEAMGISPGRLSKIVGGFARPTEGEKNHLARILGKTREELFMERANDTQETSDERPEAET